MSASMRQIEALFEAALDHPPEDRIAFLETATDDDDLRAQVARLLNVHVEADAYFDAFARDLIPEPPFGELDETPPVQIGPYRVLHELGQGGMGTVYLAERAVADQHAHFDQQVALKRMRPGLKTGDLFRRFLAERQLLARLEHPHIARLLDGGIDADHRPYFVMEYVDGVSFTDYCTDHALSIRERLVLFLDIIEAVQYAHRNLIVHRDLKPSNILVDASGTVKLLDFGIAKLLQEPESTVPVTQTLLRRMTPDYAAPEQIRGEAVTTATDVYALGVVLYEVLTDRRPYTFKTRTPGEVERVILEAEPSRPSTVSTESAARRRQLAGDLDTICLKTLRKEPERRYASAEQLGNDIRRFLDGLPVTARRDTFGYRAGKFVRRHRWGVLGSAVFVLLLAGFAATMAVQSVRIARERDKAEQVADLFVDLFRSADPDAQQDPDVPARTVLDRAAARIDAELDAQPDVQATLMDVMGRVYQNLGLYDQAAPLLQDALALRTTTLGEYHEAVAESRSHVGVLWIDQGRYAEADSILQLALDEHLRLFGEQDLRTAGTINDFAAVAYARGDYAEAEQRFAEALDLRTRLLGPDHLEVAATLNNLASTQSRQGKMEEAETTQREALRILRASLGEEHPRVVTSLNNLGTMLLARGALPEADSLFREALALRRRMLPSEHPDLAQTMGNLALVRQNLGDLDEAEALHREALDIRRHAFGDRHVRVGQSLNNLALLLHARGAYAEAERSFVEALDLLTDQLAPEHPFVASNHTNLAATQHARGKLDEAATHYRRSLDIRRKVLPETHPHTAYSLVGLGRVLIDQGDPDAAEPLLREGLMIREQTLPETHPLRIEAGRALYTCLTALNRHAEADSLQALYP